MTSAVISVEIQAIAVGVVMNVLLAGPVQRVAVNSSALKISDSVVLSVEILRMIPTIVGVVEWSVLREDNVSGLGATVLVIICKIAMISA